MSLYYHLCNSFSTASPRCALLRYAEHTYPITRNISLSEFVPGGLRAQLSLCPAGTRLGEANVHNRRCGSRRETCLRIESPPVLPPEGRYFTTFHTHPLFLCKSAFICVICG